MIKAGGVQRHSQSRLGLRNNNDIGALEAARYSVLMQSTSATRLLASDIKPAREHPHYGEKEVGTWSNVGVVEQGGCNPGL